jgi:hypothetical protein
MRRMTTVAIVVLGLFGIAYPQGGTRSAGPGIPSANVAQSTPFFNGQTYQCPTTSSSPTEVPGLGVSLSTNGGPVLVMLGFGIFGVGSASSMVMTPMVDQVWQGNETVPWAVPRGAEEMEDIIGTQGLYHVPAGVHSFSAGLVCGGSITLFYARLIVYELPGVEPPKK